MKLSLSKTDKTSKTLRGKVVVITGVSAGVGRATVREFAKYGTMTALKRMLPRNRGSIVLVGSALAYRGIPLQSAYCGAKHGVEGLFDSVRSELLHDQSNVKITMVQLPALNTTQFGWVKTRFPNKARPMGTIFQPEVAARAIVFAATHNRREVFVGYPTVQTIIGNKIAPWLGDWVLAKTGYQGQQTDEPLSPDRQHNLWEPVPGDQVSHGEFDKQAHDFSLQLWATENRTSLAIGALVATAALMGIELIRKN